MSYSERFLREIYFTVKFKILDKKEILPTVFNDNDNDNDKPIKSLLKGKALLPLVGLARLDS
jgi:hypothetical protein